MKYNIAKSFKLPFIFDHETPCLTLLMPTDQLVFNREKDRLVFKNLVKDAEKRLKFDYPHVDVEAFIKPLNELEEDMSLWDQTLKGIALYADINDIYIYLLQESVQERVIISETFHIQPLITYFQKDAMYDILALDIDHFSIFKGNMHHIDKIVLEEDINTTLKENLGYDHTESYHTHGTYGGSGDSSTFHGHGGKTDDIEIDRIKFFRAVDEQVLEHVSKHSENPLILLAQKTNQHDFKKLSKNPHVLDFSIDGSVKDFSYEQILEMLNTYQTDQFNQTMAQMLDTYHELLHHERSTDQMEAIKKALINGQVDVLMIEKNKALSEDREQPLLDENNFNQNNKNISDAFDMMIDTAFKLGTKVFVLESDQMPTSTGICAIYRYK